MADARQVIMNVRNKYPQYNNLNDSELLSALKSKYPQYNHLALKEEINQPENILLRATRAIMPPNMMDTQGQMQQSAYGPLAPAKRFADEFRQAGIENAVPGNGPAQFGLDIATDPFTWMGGANAGKLAKSATKNNNLFKNIGRMASDKKALKFSNKLEGMVEKKGSSLSKRMGAGIQSAQEVRDPMMRVSFTDELSRPQFSTKLSKLLGQADEMKLKDLDNLSLQDSQDVINSIKSNLRESIKTGQLVKSDERPILGILDELKTKQLSRFPEHKYILENYGEGINAYDEVAGKIPSMLESKGMNRITRAAKEKSLKKISPEAYKEYSGYMSTKKAVKGAGAMTGAAGIFGLGKKYGIF